MFGLGVFQFHIPKLTLLLPKLLHPLHIALSKPTTMFLELGGILPNHGILALKYCVFLV
jgi:hypothetical protein